MFGKGFRLFRLLGFEVKVDPSWLLLALLVTWSLAEGLFPFYVEGLSRQVYWAMGVTGVVGLVFSIVFHEFSHSLVARRFGMPIHGISLFIFGGVAEMQDEPPSARSEFFMAIAGPIASLVLAFGFFQLYSLAAGQAWPRPITAIAFYLTTLNVLLAGFNLVPAFPLDGGRVLRALLWGWRGNLEWATRMAAGAGSVFGAVLVAMGLFFLLSGRAIGGMWWVLIGLFLRNAAEGSYRQVLLHQRAAGRRVRELMNPNPVTVPASATVGEWVRNYVYKFHFEMFPVMDDGVLAGCVRSRDLRQVPEAEWEAHTVRELSQGCSGDNTIAPEADADDALTLITHSGNSRLLVVDKGELVGLLTLKDLVEHLRIDT